MKRLLLLLICIIPFTIKAQTADSVTKAPVRLKVETTKGSFIIELSDLTPRHRDNFLRLAMNGDYDGVLFHRVIPQFVIQGGNPCSKNATKDTNVQQDSLSGTLEAEFTPRLIHTRGALAAAREPDDINPKKASSDHQFYIVTGRYFTDFDLDKIEEKTGRKYTPEQREEYKLKGGAPHLDGNYTVFGKVIEGMNVVEKIERVETGAFDRPKKDVLIKRIIRLQ